MTWTSPTPSDVHGLTAEQLAAHPFTPSTLSLAGLIRHLAEVERIWLRQRVDVATLLREWRLADEAVAAVPFAHEIEVHGETISLRMVDVHLIGECARHNGHADLLRQALDGVTGR